MSDLKADLASLRINEAPETSRKGLWILLGVIVVALGGGGETVTDPGQIGPAIDRAMASGLPYLVNVMTDRDAAYPRSTLGI